MQSLAEIVTYFYYVLSTATNSVLEYPASTSPANGTYFDFVIVGCGTAGSVLASRLSEVSNWTVLCIEAGTTPTAASQYPGFFPFLPHTEVDWNNYSEDDGVTSQALEGKRVPCTRGKVLGGSSSINHLLYERGSKVDYNEWTLPGDNIWNYDEMLKYFKKSEKNIDPRIMNGPTAEYHSTTGIVTVNEQTNIINYNAAEAIMLKSFEEIGISAIPDISVPAANGTAQGSMMVTEDGDRANAARAYLYSINRTNFYWMEQTNVTKIIFDENKQAIGVRAQTSNGEVFIGANKEVILSASTFNSPQLLMLSGVGPKEDLESLNIDVVQDLPVGRILKDHISVAMVTCGNISTEYSMEELAASADLTTMPLPVTCGSYTLKNVSADMQVITAKFTPQSVLSKVLLCTDFNYREDMIDSVIDQCGNREIFVTLVVSTKYESSGNVTLRSADPNDSPKVYTGYMSVQSDVDYMVKNLKLVYTLQNSSYFQEVGGYFSRPPLSDCDTFEFASDDYWQCYAKSFASTALHPSCTNAMGKVVDGYLKVKGVSNLRVCDDSIYPTIPSAKTCATTIAVAEKLADLIKEDYGISTDNME